MLAHVLSYFVPTPRFQSEYELEAIVFDTEFAQKNKESKARWQAQVADRAAQKATAASFLEKGFSSIANAHACAVTTQPVSVITDEFTKHDVKRILKTHRCTLITQCDLRFGERATDAALEACGYRARKFRVDNDCT